MKSKNMTEIFQMGGIFFMSILTIQLAGVIVIAGRYMLKSDKSPRDLDLVRSAGLFAAVTGILGQLIGLFQAFQAIEKMGSVSPAMLAGGLKVSCITTLYGLLIYLAAIVIWWVLRLRFSD